MAKPTPADLSLKCASANEEQTRKACVNALKSESGPLTEDIEADIESCVVDVCATGDLKGTLNYLIDFKKVNKKEKSKLKAKRKRDAKLSKEARQKKAAKNKARHAKKKETASKHKESRKKVRAKKETSNKARRASDKEKRQKT